MEKEKNREGWRGRGREGGRDRDGSGEGWREKAARRKGGKENRERNTGMETEESRIYSFGVCEKLHPSIILMWVGVGQEDE